MDMYHFAGSVGTWVKNDAAIGSPMSSINTFSVFKNPAGRSSGIRSCGSTVTSCRRSGCVYLIVAIRLCTRERSDRHPRIQRSLPLSSAVPPARHNNQTNALGFRQILLLLVPLLQHSHRLLCVVGHCVMMFLLQSKNKRLE